MIRGHRNSEAGVGESCSHGRMRVATGAVGNLIGRERQHEPLLARRTASAFATNLCCSPTGTNPADLMLPRDEDSDGQANWYGFSRSNRKPADAKSACRRFGLMTWRANLRAFARQSMRLERGNRGLQQALVAIAFLTLSGLAGARTTIKTIAAHDPLACRQFLDMVKAAGIPEMSDAQLCDFRFERLPPSIAKHFTAIDWKPLEVKDPVAMYRRMWVTNKINDGHNNMHFAPDFLAAARGAAADHNLGFYTAQVRLQGKGPEVTVVKMDVLRGCTKLPAYLKNMPMPFYALYKGPLLQHPLPIYLPPYDGEQMMLWGQDGQQIPYLMHVFYKWESPIIPGRPADYSNVADMNSLVPAKVKSGIYRDTVYLYGRCAYVLRSKTLPTGATTPSKESKP